MTINNILVPTDFSECTIDAFGYAGIIAKATGAKITALHVIESYNLNSSIASEIIKVHEKAEEQVKESLNEVIKSCNGRLSNVEVDIRVAKGKTHLTIKEVAEEIEADLIVMGTNGSSNFRQLEKYFLGTNAHRTIQDAPCPVITLRDGNKMEQIKNIVLPLDMENVTTQKIDCAYEFAKQFNAAVHFVTVVSTFEEFTENTDPLERTMLDAAQKFANSGIKTFIKVLKQGNVPDAVQRYVQKVDADLTIIMTRNEGAVNEFFLGSRARKMVSQMKKPVMSLQPKAV